MISKIKKSSEELQKKYEALGVKYRDSMRQLTTFNEKFDMDDLERVNEIEGIEERLKEEGECIGGNCSKSVSSFTPEVEDSA